jgi:phosphotransferase system HPr (HPr) family protein
MGMMSLGILEGEDVTVTVDGEDEVSAMKKIEAYLLANADN